jgi:basic membrane protein A
MLKRLSLPLVLWLCAALVLAACAAPTPTAPAATQAPEATSAPAATAAGAALKLAAIFPGPITDADYNTLGYNGLEAMKAAHGVEYAYSENVAVPDVDRVMREYLADGYNIVFTHGSQFINQTQTLAAEFPDAYFIAETDGQMEGMPPNLWIIDRNFHVGFYAIGALAARATETGKIGYIGGLELPFAWSELHAMQQAIADSGLDVELRHVFTGNFNDPVKARELAEAMMAEDVDVIVGSLNLGMVGIFEAVKGRPVMVTAKYTDKSSFAPDNYITSLLYDFDKPMVDVVGHILAGEGGGYYPLGFDTGVQLQTPLQHVPDDVAAEVEQIAADLVGGTIQVERNVDPIE